MKKRLLTSLLSLVMVLTMLPSAALAADTTFSYDYDRDSDGTEDICGW